MILPETKTKNNMQHTIILPETKTKNKLRAPATHQIITKYLGDDVSTLVWECITGNNNPRQRINSEQAGLYGLEELIINIDEGFFGACKGGHIDIIKLLIKNEYNYQRRDNYNFYININTMISKHKVTEKVKIIYNKGLKYACEGGHMDVVELLIDCGADNFDTCLFIACKYNHVDIVKLLLKKINTNNRLLNKLYTNIEIVKFMIENGTTHFGNTSSSKYVDELKIACSNGYADIIELLITYGASNFNDGLMCACQGGHIDIVKLMVEKGSIDFNDFIEAIKIASELNYTHIVEYLLLKLQLL